LTPPFQKITIDGVAIDGPNKQDQGSIFPFGAVVTWATSWKSIDRLHGAWQNVIFRAVFLFFRF